MGVVGVTVGLQVGCQGAVGAHRGSGAMGTEIRFVHAGDTVDGAGWGDTVSYGGVHAVGDIEAGCCRGAA